MIQVSRGGDWFEREEARIGLYIFPFLPLPHSHPFPLCTIASPAPLAFSLHSDYLSPNRSLPLSLAFSTHLPLPFKRGSGALTPKI